jgi:adenylate cyclase
MDSEVRYVMAKEPPKEVDVVFLIADLSGYTALTEAHGNVSAAYIVTRYMEILEQVLEPGVRFVERVGDEALITSADAASILKTAIRLRGSLEEEPLFPTFHVGIHGGSVLEIEGRYIGKALNLASRLASHARGNQILCTKQVVSVAGNVGDIKFRALGPTYFKNIVKPVEIFEVIGGQRRAETNLLDPVCRMQVRQETAPARLPFGGKMYYFCSFDCVKIFVNNPDSYIVP